MFVYVSLDLRPATKIIVPLRVGRPAIYTELLDQIFLSFTRCSFGQLESEPATDHTTS